MDASTAVGSGGMSDVLPSELIEERDALIAEVYAAFAGVTRESGISWSEAAAQGTGLEDESLARAKDTDTAWQQLVDDKEWEDGEGYGNYAFLDAIGYRYYLPITMIRSLRGEESEFVMCRLMTMDGVPSAYSSEQWSALDARQRASVAHFLLCMTKMEKARTGRSWFHLDRYWAQFLPDGSGESLPTKPTPATTPSG